MSGNGNAIEARAVVAGYRDRPVLRSVSLAARPGELVAVLGPNGAGKSTLVRVLAGTLQPDDGEVFLDGRPIAQLSRKEVAKKLAIVPQESDVAFGFTVREVVMMGRAPHQGGLLIARQDDLEAVDQALERCELGELAARPAAELSGGERRRVTIARALAQKPSVLVLDEAAAHLDIRHAVSVYRLARREVEERNVACVAVMHDLNAAWRWADRVVLLHEGSVRAAGARDVVLEAGVLAEVFGLPIRSGTDPEDGARYFVPAEAGTRDLAK